MKVKAALAEMRNQCPDVPIVINGKEVSCWWKM